MPNIESIKTLVVEDSDVDYRLLQEYAKQMSTNIDFDRESSVKGADSLIKTNRYDIILLDLHVDDSEGIETVEKIINSTKNSKYNDHTNVIVMTGTEDWKLAKMSLSLGARDYIKKEELTSVSLERSINLSTYHKNMPVRKKGFFGF